MSEHEEQTVVITWCRIYENTWPELRWIFAIPNGAKTTWAKNKKTGGRYSLEAQKLKAEGLLPGVSDLFLPVPRGGYHGLFIELKYGRNKPTPEQVEFMAAMNEIGYLAVCCNGADATIQTIQKYLEQKRVIGK